LRGRTITTAYLFRLEDRIELPPVKGGDDAADAKWIPLSEIRATHVYEDHYHILQTLLGGGV
jgi:bifunctional NMN adenylyltransferase/nudix hydrolase